MEVMETYDTRAVFLVLTAALTLSYKAACHIFGTRTAAG